MGIDSKKKNILERYDSIKSNYKLKLDFVFDYRKLMNELPGHIFIDNSGIYVAEYNGNRIIKFDINFGNPVTFINEIERPAGGFIKVNNEEVWLCGRNQKKMYCYFFKDNKVELKNKFFMDNENPHSVLMNDDSKNIFVLSRVDEDFKYKIGTVWRLQEKEFIPIIKWDKNKYCWLASSSQHLIMFELSKKLFVRYEKNGQLLEKVELSNIKSSISSATVLSSGEIILTDEKNYLYKFTNRGEFIYRSNILQNLVLRNSGVLGGFNGNLFEWESNIYCSDVRNGYIVRINIR